MWSPLTQNYLEMTEWVISFCFSPLPLSGRGENVDESKRMVLGEVSGIQNESKCENLQASLFSGASCEAMFIILTLGLNMGRHLRDARCFGNRFRQAESTHPGGWTVLTACILLMRQPFLSGVAGRAEPCLEKTTGVPALWGGLASTPEEWECWHP